MANELNDLFASKPMDFFRRYPVAPPAVGGSEQKLISTIYSGLTPYLSDSSADGKIRHMAVKDNKGVVWIDFHEKGSICGEPEAVTFKTSTSRQEGWVPVHFLPWGSMNVVSLEIPEIKERDLDTSSSVNPHLFFTAAINGCSVFVQGSPRSPAVYHAGVDGKLSVNAEYLWRDCMKEILKSAGKGNQKFAEVNKTDYTKNRYVGNGTSTEPAAKYRKWLEDENRGQLIVQEVTPWGCVFGIRYGRMWTFYLQENVTVSTLRVTKKSNVSFGRSYMKEKGTDKTVIAQTTKKLGPIKQTVYYVQNMTTRPIQIREIFPAKSNPIQVKKEIKMV